MSGRILGLLLVCAASPLTGSCGAGVIGVAASSGGSSGGGAPTITAFEVPNPKVSPATLRIEASASVVGEVTYQRHGGREEVMTRLTGPGVSGNRVELPAGTTDLIWDFAAEIGAAFVSDVDLFVRLPGGVPIAGGSLSIGMGNDVPVVDLVEPMPTDPDDLTESSGNVEVRLVVSDSSSDVVELLVEWRRASDAPDTWQVATAAGVFPEGIETDPDGVELSFFWNTNIDLEDGDDDVLLRVTPDDRTTTSLGAQVGEGEPLESSLFHVDNNEEPILQLFNDLVITNADQRRGIPIPFRAIDEEGDLIEALFQWRRGGEEFPSLDTDGDGTVTNPEVDGILADPVLRAERHVCSEYPRYAQGRVVPVDETSLRLPELASKESWILASGLVGRTLELLRPSQFVAPITPTWRENPFVQPIAALPVGDGLTAIVLDVPGAAGRLREIELATGEIVCEIATLAPGMPTAMTFEHSRQALLVASDLGSVWRIDRIELDSGAITPLFSSDATAEPPPVRGLASLGTMALCLTAGSSLLFLDYRDLAAPRLGLFRDELAMPWGVATDPLAGNRVYVAERDAARPDGTGRVLALEVDSHGSHPVVVRTGSPLVLEGPTSIAVDERGARLLAVTVASPLMRQLTGMSLGGRGGNLPFALGEPFSAEAGSLASGPDRLVLLALPGADQCLVGGGVEQRRAIVTSPGETAYEPRGQLVVVDEAFDPAPRKDQPCRIRSGTPRKGSPRGTDAVFLWNSSEIPGESAFLRGIPRDDEAGLAGEGAAAKSIRAPLDVDPVRLGNIGSTHVPADVAAADLDSDGDLDLVSANQTGNNLRLLVQNSPRTFNLSIALGSTSTTTGPRSVVTADLDGDGHVDIACANSGGNSLTAFFQDSALPGRFGAPSLLPLPASSDPFSVGAADLDGDGDLDLVSANYGVHDLRGFLQLSPGDFDSGSLALGGPAITDGPFSVATGDLDGDGDVDVVSANDLGNDLTAFFQLSPGNFGLDPLRLGSLATTRAPGSIVASDLDADGALDLVSGNSFGLNLSLFYQREPGEFDSLPVVLGGRGVTDFPVDVRAADLDGDGDQDIVSVNNLGEDLSLFTQVARGSFDPIPLSLAINTPQAGGPVAVAIGDLDGDGRQDLVTANFESSNLTVFFQAPPGNFDPGPLLLGDLLTTQIPVCVAATDLDGDGDQDIVSANRLGSNLTVFHQLTPRIFDPSPLAMGGTPITISPLFVASADLGSDGDQDLVSANQFSNTLTIFFQDSPGNFDPIPLSLGDSVTTNQPACVAAADLDGDGNLDLASANQGGNNLSTFFQSLSGSFDLPPLQLGDLTTTNRPAFVIASDLDGDGGVDLASANQVGLTVFYQESPGTFGPDPLGFGGSTVAAADLDGDGDQDLATTSASGNGLTVFHQVESRGFELAQAFEGVGAPVSIAAKDLDRDGDVDLVFAAGNNLKILFQFSPGIFGPTPVVLGGTGITELPASIIAAEIDGDGEPDLVSANTSVNTRNLTVFWGGQ